MHQTSVNFLKTMIHTRSWANIYISLDAVKCTVQELFQKRDILYQYTSCSNAVLQSQMAVSAYL